MRPLNVETRHRHFARTVMALHGGSFLCGALATLFSMAVADELWKAAALAACVALALEAMVFVPAIRRLRELLMELADSEAKRDG